MHNRLFVILTAILLLCCLTVPAAAEGDVAQIGTAGYSTLQAAVDAYEEEPIRLLADYDESITVSKDTYLDLNGFDITGKVTVTAGTLYCMDSQTDDYTVQDAAGYGKLTDVTGSVAGVPVGATCTEDGYLMVRDEVAFSFHRVNLQIYAMTLRADQAGVYYKSHFAADEVAAEWVVSYGIALSVKEIPNPSNLEESCKYSAFSDFQPGGNDRNSTLLQNIMEESDTQQTNEKNSQMPIYGRAYILTDQNEYLFGNAVSRSLEKQVQLAASDENWTKLTSAQKDATVSMYRNYVPVMRQWGIKNVESYMSLNGDDPLAPANKKSLKVLAVTSSFGLNTTQLLYDVAVAEGYAPENVTVARLYTSGCTLEKHIQYAPDKPVYQYTKVSGDPAVVAEHAAEGQVVGKLFTVMKEGNATLLDGLLDEEWDIIFMQQGARVSSIRDSYTDAQGRDYIDQLRTIMQPYVDQHCPDARFVWNMLWAYDKGSPQYPFNTTFNSDQMAMYQASVDCTMEYVVPRNDYDRIIPTGTAIQNARTSFFGETLSRDTYHLNNLGGTIAAYGLFAVITGQEITEVNLDIVAASAKNGIGSAAKITTPFREDEKLVIMESVNNALRNPYGVTPSQYPPEDYSGYNYTDNLKFVENTNVAVCPVCKSKATWIEINQENVKQLESQGLLGTALTSSYHFYLSEDVEFTAAAAGNSVFHLASGVGNICVHLNGNDLTATNCAISIIAGNGKLNMMGNGTVSGNHTHSTKFRGSAFILNSGTTASNSGTLRLYSGTYVQPASSTQLAPISTSHQGGLLEIFKDVTVTGAAGKYSVSLHTNNNKTDGTVKYDEEVNIYGGTFNGAVHTESYGYASIQNTQLNIYGGKFNDGVEIDSNTDLTLSGTPVIKGVGMKLPAGTTVTVGDLTDGADILVNAQGAFTEPTTSAYFRYFRPITEDYTLYEEGGVFCCKSVAYTRNLAISDGSNIARCPVCGEDKEWIEVNEDNVTTLAYFGTSGTMPSGSYHFYLSTDVTYEGTNYFLNMGSNGRNVCLHLNGHDLTASNNAIAVIAGNAKLNMMGTGTVSGNHKNASTFRGSAFILNSGTTADDPGTLRLYSGTYVQPASSTQLAPISTSHQGGLLEIFKDVTVTGAAGKYSVSLHTNNNKTDGVTKYDEVVNIYGGTFYGAVHTETYTYSSIQNTRLNIYGGTFHDGVEIDAHTDLTLSGTPVIKGAGLKLPTGTTVTVDALTDGASILVDAQGAFAKPTEDTYLRYFKPVKDGYTICQENGVFYCQTAD